MSYLSDYKFLLDRLGVTSGMRVADIGSGGHDYYIRPLANQVGKDGKVYVVDVRESALSALMSHVRHHGLSHVIPVKADAEMFRSIPVDDEHCERVTVVNMLHQVSDSSAVLREAGRILHPRGMMLVVDWHGPAGTLGPTLGKYLPASEVVRNAGVYGLTPVQHFMASPFHYGILFVKH